MVSKLKWGTFFVGCGLILSIVLISFRSQLLQFFEKKPATQDWGAAVSPGTEIKTLVGTWTASGELEGGFSWSLEYTFDGKNYSLKGYPPLSETGTYAVQELAVGDTNRTTLTIVFSPQTQKETHIHKAYFIDRDHLVLEKETYTRSK